MGVQMPHPECGFSFSEYILKGRIAGSCGSKIFTCLWWRKCWHTEIWGSQFDVCMAQLELCVNSSSLSDPHSSSSLTIEVKNICFEDKNEQLPSHGVHVNAPCEIRFPSRTSGNCCLTVSVTSLSLLKPWRNAPHRVVSSLFGWGVRWCWTLPFSRAVSQSYRDTVFLAIVLSLAKKKNPLSYSYYRLFIACVCGHEFIWSSRVPRSRGC